MRRDDQSVISRETGRHDRTTEGRPGPVFLVGMSRSGTKLLRDLLNQHPRVGIPRVETHFLPNAIKQLGTRPEFDHRDLSVLRSIVEASPFYWNVTTRRGEYDTTKLLSDLESPDWTTVFRRLVLGGLTEYKDVEIWGDKTPAYLANLPLLHRTFPSGSFIHLVRDPRDRSLSVRRTWGKDVLRAAYRWETNVMEARRFARDEHDADLLEVRYEDLLNEPEKSLRKVANFLSIEFEQEMLTLESPSETYGDASGRSDIVQGNTGKFLSGLSESEVRRIEQIAWSGLRAFGYDVLHATGPEPISGSEHLRGRVFDAFKVVRFHLAEKGIVKGARYLARLISADTWGRYDAR